MRKTLVMGDGSRDLVENRNRPSRELQDLPPEHLGRGMDSRQELQGGLQVSGRGMNSRQEVRHQDVECSRGNPQVDRERWLLRELAQLQQALDSEKRSKGSLEGR